MMTVQKTPYQTNKPFAFYAEEYSTINNHSTRIRVTPAAQQYSKKKNHDSNILLKAL
jgi:hypothetical protein